MSTRLASHACQHPPNMNHAAKDEIDALTDLYTTTFPSEAIRILLSPAADPARSLARELPDAAAAAALQQEGWYPVDIMGDNAPLRYFAVASAHGEKSDQPLNLLQQIRETLRRIIIRGAPILYETLKYILLGADDLLHRLLRRSLPSLPARIEPPVRTVPPNSPRRRMLVTLQWLDVGGAEAFAAHAIERAVARGARVWVISQTASRIFYRRALERVEKYFELDRQLPRAYQRQFIENLCRKHGIEVLHNHHNKEIYACLPALRRAFPGLIVADSLHIEERFRYQRGAPGYSIIWSPWINYHHVVSKTLAKSLMKAGIAQEKILVGRLGGEINPSPNFRLGHSLAARRLKICFVGRMILQKRPLLAMEMLAVAIRIGRKLGVHVTADVIGDGFYRGELERSVRAHNLSDSVAFHAANVDVPKLMRGADVLLISSDNEGLTLVGCEAFNAGCLTVSCDVGAQSEIVPEELLLPRRPSSCVRAWKRLVVRMLSDPQFVQLAGEHAQQKMIGFAAVSTADSALDRVNGDLSPASGSDILG